MLVRAIRLRLVIAPALGALALTFAFFEPTTWRRVVLASAVTLMFGLSLVEWLRYRKYGLGVVLVPVNLALTVIGQLSIMTGSGGLFSPVFPAVVVMVVLTAVLSERRTLIGLLLLIVPYVWWLAFVHVSGWPVGSLVPEIFGGAQPIERGVAPFVAAGMYSIVVGATARIGNAVQRMFQELFEEALAERDRSLALHSEQSRSLVLLTSEIAHELKNPLASIKGLGGLLTKDVTGRAAERLGVLRGEVERMQGVLDGFLNLSRPLLPLNLEKTNLRELARDVARLHEGSASERAVAVEVLGPSNIELSCDARKVRQVLINLLQNALEASPRDGKVTVRVERSDNLARALVVDQGAGLAEHIASRLFEPGVTSKEQGSGIGLVVSRSLARQHGGDVELAPGPGGGLVAILSLPLSPQGESP
jgi:two-component system sensor histidine kinase HydH